MGHIKMDKTISDKKKRFIMSIVKMRGKPEEVMKMIIYSYFFPNQFSNTKSDNLKELVMGKDAGRNYYIGISTDEEGEIPKRITENGDIFMTLEDFFNFFGI